MSRLPVERADHFHYFHMNPHHALHPEAYDVAQHSAPSSLAIADFPDYWQPQQYQRKRPKYTRSKTGCLTCRGKKVKCDEEKPDCARCRAGGRECVWPDLEASRKRSARREVRPAHSPSVDARPSTAGSSGRSEASISPSRHFAHLKAEHVEQPLPPSALGRTAMSEYAESPAGHFREAYHDSQLQGLSSTQYGSSGKAPDTRGYAPPPEHVFVPPPKIDTPQFFAHQPSRQPTMPVGHYQQSSCSYPNSNSQPYLGYPNVHTHGVKPEYDDQEWQNLLSQHVDPLHPLAYPATQDYYNTSHVNTSASGQSSQDTQPSYPYLKYP